MEGRVEDKQRNGSLVSRGRDEDLKETGKVNLAAAGSLGLLGAEEGAEGLGLAALVVLHLVLGPGGDLNGEGEGGNWIEERLHFSEEERG